MRRRTYGLRPPFRARPRLIGLASTCCRRSGSQLLGVDNSRMVIFLDDYGQVASALPVPDAELTLRDLSVTTVHLLSDRLHEPSDVTVRIMIDGSEAEISDARLEEEIMLKQSR